MSALLEVILPVFLLIACGYLAVMVKFFSESSIDALMKFAQHFAIPLLLFRAISTLDLSAGYQPGLMISYYSGSVVGFAVGLAGARYLFHRTWADSVAIGFAALFANSVLLGLPIMERAYGSASLGPNYAIVSIHAPFCYFLGITTMEIVKGAGGGLVATAGAVLRAMFRNALMVAIALGFAVNIAGITLPATLSSAIGLVTPAALPAALFALGGILYRYRPEGDLKVVLFVCLISLFLHPSITLFLSRQVFDLSDGLVRSAVLNAAMAPGVNSYVFASLYGVAQRTAAAAVLAGTLFSIVSITFWLVVLGM